jgi:DNA-binding winged helix-turn-helix (wHTH) protein/TolB-like protein
MNASKLPERLRFGPFVLDTRRAELLRDGVTVALRPKPFALLATLTANPNTLLAKEELLEAVWPGVVVTEDSLTQAVHELRAALGDAGPQLVRTVARRGYRFDAEVVDDALTMQAGAEPAPAGDVEAAAAVAPRAQPVLRRIAVVAFVGAALAAATWLLYEPAFLTGHGRAIEAQGPKAPRLSIVVLPLEVEAGSEGGAWFSDPLSADLTSELGKVSGAVVISPDTAFTYKGKQLDPREVARQLNVRYVVQGTVRRKENDVRLNLSLIDGESGRQRWAEEFAMDRANLRHSLEQVTSMVSRTLGVEVYRAEGQRAAALKPGQVEADDLAMSGWAVWYRGLSRENTIEALRRFESAVARDPDSLRGWAGLAIANGTAVSSGWAPNPAAASARHGEAIRQLERLDRNDVFTHMARIGAYYLTEDFAGLLQLTQTLVERFPNHPHGHHHQANALMLLGRFDECVEPLRKAARLGPRDTMLPYWRSGLAMCHFFAGRYPEAVGEARLAIQANTALAGPHLILAAALARNGQVEEAQKIVRENAARDRFRIQTLRLVLLGNEPRLAKGRERIIATLKELGVR